MTPVHPWDKSPLRAWRRDPDPEGRFLLPRARWSDFAFTLTWDPWAAR